MDRYHYRGRLHKIIDGDTCDLMVDLGFRAYMRVRVRLVGFSAPELRAHRGREASSLLESILTVEGDYPLLVRTMKDAMSFERWLASVYVPDPETGWKDVADLFRMKFGI